MGGLSFSEWLFLIVALLVGGTISLGFIVGIPYLLIRWLREQDAPGDLVYCTICGAWGQDRRIMSGSVGMELFMWVLLLVPGLLYSIWRLSTAYRGCTTCGAAQIVPPNSPIAIRAQAERRSQFRVVS